jgi:DUF1016 N-terminal domain
MGGGGDRGCGVQARATTVWAYQKGRESASVAEEGAVAELIPVPSGYPALLEDLKTRIRAAQLRASLTLNQETIQLYWSIGQDLSSRFAAEGWGTKVGTVLPRISGRNFPAWRASASGIFVTCVPLPRRGLTPKFCSLLQNCLGDITWSYSIG